MRLNTKVDVAKSSDGNYAKVIMDPLDKGYGVTLGNAMRRVLLSSLEGSAVTAIRIEGVHHEFGTIEGIKEDLLNIILNIKSIIVKSHSSTPKIVKIEMKKAGDVLVSDIQHDDEIVLINPSHKICTITAKNVNFKVEMRIERGVGYRLSDLNHYENIPVGTIPVDSSFSPIIKVNHTVTATRVGNRTDLDKLVMEIWTNGSVSAEEALDNASHILIDSFSLFTDYKHVVQAYKETDKLKGVVAPAEVDLTIEDLELSARSSNCLRKAGILKVLELVEKPMKDLMKIKNFGKKSADEINEKLMQYGLKLKED
ncbi:MAG: DNA-directed RNA polymerase subunit alpha [Candidatus Margulisiibacteriota bacterium]